MVKKGSVKKKEIEIESKKVQETVFTVTDFEKEISVYYIGIFKNLSIPFLANLSNFFCASSGSKWSELSTI